MGCFLLLGLYAEYDCIQLQTYFLSEPWKGEEEGGKIYVCRITDAGRCKCCVVSSCIMCESISDLKKQQTRCNLLPWIFHLLPDPLVMNVQLCHLLPSRSPLWELLVIFLCWKKYPGISANFCEKTFVKLLQWHTALSLYQWKVTFVDDFLSSVSFKSFVVSWLYTPVR